MTKPQEQQELDAIRQYVHNYRKAHGVVPTYGRKPELSCIIHGEGHNLLYRQLIPTVDDGGVGLNLNIQKLGKWY